MMTGYVYNKWLLCITSQRLLRANPIVCCLIMPNLQSGNDINTTEMCSFISVLSVPSSSLDKVEVVSSNNYSCISICEHNKLDAFHICILIDIINLFFYSVNRLCIYLYGVSLSNNRSAKREKSETG